MTFEQLVIKSVPQYFYVAVNQVVYKFKVYWSETQCGGWVLDVYTSEGDVLIAGVAVCCDTDILEQFKSVCPFVLICVSGNEYNPNQGQLGNTHPMYVGV